MLKNPENPSSSQIKSSQNSDPFNFLKSPKLKKPKNLFPQKKLNPNLLNQFS
jgi:hypothetical protein